MERLTERLNDELHGICVKDHDYISAAKKLADYEDLGLTPEQIKEMDRIYSEQSKELGKYKNAEEKLNGISMVELADAYISIMEKMTGEKYSRGRLLTNIDADKWDEYKNADNKDLLIKLPCRVGDRLYQPTEGFISEYIVGYIEVSTFNNLFFHTGLVKGVNMIGGILPEDEIGRTVFLTRDQAEAAIKEMEDKNE